MSEELLNYVPEEGLLNGRVILVTGAGAGIGRAIAVAYARYGATVVLLDKEVKRLEEVYDEITDKGYPQPAIYPMDLSGAITKDYEDLAANIKDQLGKLDGLALNAGWLSSFTPFKHYEIDTWGKVLTVNMNANFLIIHSCLPLLEEAEDPAIVFSTHSSNKAYFGAFGVAKGGLDAMCDILAEEYSADNSFIRINRIDTGPARTQMRTLNFPGENPETVVRPEALVGPYLYFMGPDAGQRSGEAIKYERIAADKVWPGEQ